MQRGTLPRPLGRIFALILAVSSFAMVTVAQPGVVWAQDIESKLAKALASAVDDYDVLQIQDAEKRLEDAIKLADKNKFKGPALAKIWAMLGVVRFAATRDEAITEDAFVAAVENDPKVEIDPNYATPTLDDVMKRARKRAAPAATDTNTQPAVSELTHKPIATADAGKDLEFEAFVPADMPVYRMFVLFRRFDEPDFNRVEMQPTNKTRFAAKIPGKEIRTSQIDYFIFAEDRGGDIIAKVGSDNEPLNMVVLGSSNLTQEDPKKNEPAPTDTAGRKWVSISLLGGTGGGFLAGSKATANPETDVNPGVAPAFGHALLDVGVLISPTIQLGLYFRYQFAPSQDFTNLVIDQGGGFYDTKEECLGLGLPGDCLIGLKYKWFFQNTDSMRVYSSIGSGVGRVRNWVQLPKLASLPVCAGKETFAKGSDQYCYLRDTVRTGWVHFGVGGGLAFPLTDFMDFTTDLYLMLLVPDTSVNVDLSAGLTFRL
ncbi:MAG: hypothetical protein R3E66_13700 [bacterium]